MAKEKDTKEPDFNEVCPPIDTKGKSFDELLKGIAGVDPKTLDKPNAEK